MTVAISKAAEQGAKAVVCASTGNTSASAAAFAARAGLTCAVLIPEGHIALGKLAQALIHGARVLQVRGNFDQALAIVRELGERAPVTVVNSVNPFRIEGQKSGAFEIVDELGNAPDVHCIPVGNAGQHHRLLEGLPRVQGGGPVHVAAPHARLPGSRSGADRRRPPHRAPGHGRHGHPDRQPGQLVRGDRRPPPSRAVASPRSPTRRSSRRTATWRPRSRSSASRRRPRRSPACSSTGSPTASVRQPPWCACSPGHGLKDPDIAISQISVPTVVDADLAAVLDELSL